MERSLTFTIDNGVAEQSADASLLGILQSASSPFGQRHFQEQEVEFLDEANDDDNDLTTSEEINREVTINLPPWAIGPEFQDLIARFRQEPHGGAAGEEVDSVFVPASDAALAGLEKHAFDGTMAEGYDHESGITTGCAICLEDFEDGEEVTAMPCSRGHLFHPDCITMWLGKNNTCPLCRHALPTDVMVMDDWM